MKNLLTCALAASTLALVSQASATTMLVDRGLPVANLNNAAGVNRSNVDWGTESGVTLMGDTFANTSTSFWAISTIRVWTDGLVATPPENLALWGGVNGVGSFSLVSSAYVRTPTTYVGGSGYQASGGSFYDLFQVDFAVNVMLAPGQVFSFFLDGNDPILRTSSWKPPTAC
jgi:hypothetical protein